MANWAMGFIGYGVELKHISQNLRAEITADHPEVCFDSSHIHYKNHQWVLLVTESYDSIDSYKIHKLPISPLLNWPEKQLQWKSMLYNIIHKYNLSTKEKEYSATWLGGASYG